MSVLGQLWAWGSRTLIGGLLGVALLATGCGTASAQSTPILRNAQFTEGTQHWWGPGWRLVPDAGEGGKPALRIEGGYAAQDKRPVQAGMAYRISIRARGEAAPAGSLYVQASFRGNGVAPDWRGEAMVKVEGRSERAVLVESPGSDWHTYSGVVVAPPNAGEIVVYLRKLPGSAGAVFIDRAEVALLGPATEFAPRVAQAKDRLNASLRAPQWAATPGPVRTAPASLRQRLLAEGNQALPLAEGGRALARIVVAQGADPMTLHAAGELAHYLGRISGANFLPLLSEADELDGPLILVGYSDWVKALCPELDLASLGPDGFVLRSMGRSLVVAGATPRGTMYGVNWLLDRKLGVRWLAPQATHVPQRASLSLPVLDETQRPRFAYREVLNAEAEDKAFRAHNLLNGESHGTSFRPTPPELDSWDRSWAAQGGSATFHELLPPSVHGKAHPEWFAGGQLAMMNPQVRQLVAKAVVERLRRLPDYRAVWFVIHDMDWGWDMDPESQAFAEAHGGQPSAPRLDMVIDVANRVRAELPGARLAFNAYHWSFTPPQGMTVPEHVLVFPMTIHVDYSTALNRGRNKPLGQDIEGWSRMARQVLVWDHVTNFAGFIQPTPNLYPIADSIRWLAGLPSVQGYFAEGSWFTQGAEFAALRAWLIARLLWDPSQDPRALVAEYCRDYFGAAAAPMQRYIDEMHEAIARGGDVLAEKTQVDLAMFDARFISRADQLFDAAERAVAGDAVLLARVRQERMAVDYVALVRRHDLAQDAARAKLDWQVDKDRRLERLRATAAASKLKLYRQDGPLAALWELIAVERRTPPKPAAVAQLAPQDWRFYQDWSFNQYDSARIVADGQASDGAALRMSAASWTWAAQFKFDKLPATGQWDLYARVRAEVGAASPSAAALRVGAYPPMGRFTAVPVSEVGAGYRWVKVPGGPFAFSADHGRGVYVQAGGGNGVQSIFVDGILAVRAGAAIDLTQP